MKVDSSRAFVLFVLVIHDRAEPVMDLLNVCYLTCVLFPGRAADSDMTQ